MLNYLSITSGWELEMMEAEARDSEEETDNDVAKRKSVDQTVENRQAPSLHNEPSSAIHNPRTESPALRRKGNPESRGQNHIPATTQDFKKVVNLPTKVPLHSGPTKAAAPGPIDNSNSSSSIQVATSGTNMELEKMANLALKSSSLHSRPTTSAVIPLKSPDTDGLTMNPDLTTPDVNVSIGASLLQGPPASSIALGPPVKSPALGPFNNQGARDRLVTAPHEESGLKKLNLHVKSPFGTGNHMPTAASGLPSQNSDLPERSVAPNSSKDRENLDKMAQIDSKKMVNLPIDKSPLVISNHTQDASTRQFWGADFSRETGNLVRIPDEKMKSGERAISNVNSSLVIAEREQIMVQISSGKDTSLTKVCQSKIESKSCMSHQYEVRHDEGYSLETPHRAKPAALSLSENKEVASSELVSSTNLVITCSSTTTPQIGIGSKRDLNVPCESPLESLKCQNVSSDCELSSCGGRLPVLTSSSALKKIYARKLRKNSASPHEQQSDPSVNNATTKVVSGTSPPGLGNKHGEANRDVEIEKSAEQSCTSLPQKRKASEDFSHIIPLVANELKEPERINSLPKEADAFTDEQVEHGISNCTGNDTSKLISKTLRTRRTSLKCAKPPMCSPSNLNNIGTSEAADKVQVKGKMELVTDKQSNVLDFSSYFGSSTEKTGVTTPSFVAQGGDNEMKHALNQTRKVEMENKMLEIKGLTPDSIESEMYKHPNDAISETCNNHKHSAGARIKMAVAKRSIKGKLQNPSINGYLKAGNNSSTKPDSGESGDYTMNDGTKDKVDASDAGSRDADSGDLREVRCNSSVNPEVAKALENGIGDKAETPNMRPKSATTNVSRKLGTAKGAAPETKKKSSNHEGSKSTSNKSNVTMGWLSRSTELDPEKENKPGPGERSTAESKTVLKCKEKQVPTQKECTGAEDHKTVHAGIGPVTCFILSGHRLQRKEFQAVIKKLRGRVCRDTHNWSFQATHFIVPGPVRRTEKFFAAAASGRYTSHLIATIHS
jgi:hypothetical protein